ncbi:hypothetical protein [Halogeometricum luteum]|uniref:PEP-CTERM protein-sorting domain-containing protein n=1 Tax=Halogeometricum luteum TaxID=2950537 RepID=A0ABU2G8Q4_9EURY|nr:hypothetical protein [Halogeometricum sp. S3BR5-2]MDS0296574.1 hypothetical protein [Halogeometricum sp. S3BR5-2]
MNSNLSTVFGMVFVVLYFSFQYAQGEIPIEFAVLGAGGATITALICLGFYLRLTRDGQMNNPS